jgi:SAM-dependent methyltransferase
VGLTSATTGYEVRSFPVGDPRNHSRTPDHRKGSTRDKRIETTGHFVYRDTVVQTVTGGESIAGRALPLPPPAGRPFDTFVHEVSKQQLAAWLPKSPQRILDLSAGCPALLDLMVSAGHDVTHAGNNELAPYTAGGRLHPVVADPRRLDWVRAAGFDAVVAEGSVLSGALATEVTLDDVHTALRPGGRLLLAVDSLLAGLSELAEQGRWAELTDVPSADVVLIPREDGRVTRCFWPEELQGMLEAAGFDVEWVRPRTVLAEETVTRALESDPERLAELVGTELRLATERQGETLGAALVASAVRR